MADPLSIAASVAGLIALSGSIYKIIGDFVERAANPPQSAHTLLLSVSEMRMVLNSVSDLVDNFLKYPPKRRALVRLDHLIICLTQTVLSFSELERFVKPWITRTQQSLWQRWKLNGQDERISRFNTKLQEHKASISLVLNILQCESDTEAQQCRLSLHEMMQKIIDENKELRTRIDQLGSFVMSSAHSTATTFGGPVATPGGRSIAEGTIGEDDDGTSTIRGVEVSSSTTTNHASHRYSVSWPVPISSVLGTLPSRSEPNFSLPFEYELAQSWVYSRVRRTECDISFTTSHPMSGIWSMLSGLSLSQVSSISIIALPITLNDVSNSSWYKPSNQAKLSKTRLSNDTLRADTHYNIAVLGECEVGKSSLITTLCSGSAEQAERYSTLGADYYKSVVVDGSENRLRITDTPGMSSAYAVLMNYAIMNAEGFVLVYSMTDLSSFLKIQPLYDEIIRTKKWTHVRRPPVVIVATKADLEESHVVSRELIYSLAEDIDCMIFECSTKSDDSVAQPFIEVVKRRLGGRTEDNPLHFTRKSRWLELIKSNDLQDNLI
ncbi:P-loop containing nucleoside triphosphate hydrolase protein [Xylariaceae sp. AK1471]|nr:P-loop containing nucleoside triphosphate hydrolase protein [Xylariaceae sp. AK1471]